MTAPTKSALKVTLPSDREIVMTRSFDAPRRLVFEAHIMCEHLVHWWGPRGSTLRVCEIDLRPGGTYRFVEHSRDGNDYGFSGVFHEIVPPERLVQTFEFDGAPGQGALETATFEEQGGKTTVTSTLLFKSKADRDGMLQSGMEEGAAETYDRLAEYLRTPV